MNKKSILLSIFDSLSTILFPIVAIPFLPMVFEALFSRYAVYENFSEQKVAQTNFGELLQYISFRTGSLSTEFYSYEDILHMRDVRMLFGICYVIFVVSILLFVFLKAEKEEKENSLMYGSFLSMGIVFLTGVSVFFAGFDKFFISFHKLFFSNDYWMLDPNSSNLIKFFPSEIFQTLLALIAASIIVISLVTLVSSIWAKKDRVSK